DGEKYRGYMFIKTPYIEAYGSYPRFHLTKCEVIQQFIEDGNFNKRYEWSNSNVNDLIDITTGKLYQNENLSYCSKCKRQLLGEIQTTSDFHEILKNAHQLEEEVEVDLFGYVKGWNRFSRAFRESKNYICDECGISPNEASHKRYWQVHHIDGDKTNNQESNLRCLCIECHSTVDAVHSQNFQSKAQQIELTRFRDLYNPKNP
ncbi:MAG: HNH endonuclease signature motif containing protein, partial [Cyclobacteriaceae bacterium]